MIDNEKRKKDRFGKSKTSMQVLADYSKTAGVSFLIALVFTLLLSFHARSEMIKNLYVNAKEQQKIDEKLARQLITQSDFTKNLQSKRYSVIMHVGFLYETANDMQNAQYAYEMAIKKAPQGVYRPYYKLAKVLIAQEKFSDASELIKSIKDLNNKKLIKFKTRSYIEMGDKYYSIGKFLSAAKSYEKAGFYYDKFVKKDKVIENSIKERIINAYIEAADIMVKNGLNTDAIRYLKKAEGYDAANFSIRYKLAIIYSDLDPEKSVVYFEKLMQEYPQNIDHSVYAKALLKSATIADFKGNNIQAKYYRYKIHSLDIYIDNKVVYKNDVEIYLENFSVKKIWFKYQLTGKYRVKNISHTDINTLSADFVLRRKGKNKPREIVKVKCMGKLNRLESNGGITPIITAKFCKNIFTKKELEQYVIDIYLYKDEKFKTLISTMPVPLKSINIF